MPRSASAAKRARQTVSRQKRLLPVKTFMKTSIRKVKDAVKAGKKKEAEALLPQTYKAIDMAAKKNIIHTRNAARKKSAVARMVH
jgi:small subunit ribosomal protein S20